MKEASKHMLDVYGSGVGSSQLGCVCGRQHVAIDSEYLEEGEADQLRARAAEKPKAYVLCANVDAVSAAVINGSTVIRDCECGWFAKLEDLIWNERERILRYYQIRRDADAAALAQLNAQLGAYPTRDQS